MIHSDSYVLQCRECCPACRDFLPGLLNHAEGTQREVIHSLPLQNTMFAPLSLGSYSDFFILQLPTSTGRLRCCSLSSILSQAKALTYTI